MTLRKMFLAIFLLSGLLGWGCQTTAQIQETGDSEEGKTPEQTRIEAGRAAHGDYYANRLAEILEDNPGRQPGGTVLLGDSITERFAADQAFPAGGVINRGIGGDTINGMRDRVDVSIVPLAPSTVYIMAGINDVIWATEKTNEDLVKEYGLLLEEIRKAAPEARTVILSVLPVRGKWADVNGRIRDLNGRLAELASQKGAGFIDVYTPMANEAGNLRSAYTVDGVHLSLNGYLALLEQALPESRIFDAAWNLMPLWRDLRRLEYEADKVNPQGPSDYPGGRAGDELVVYTPEYGKSTGTNEWGVEAVVRNGKVAGLGGNDSQIPEDGFVLSGHGAAARWITNNLSKGIPVVLAGKTVILKRSGLDSFSPSDKANEIRLRYYDALARLREEGAGTEKLAKAKELLARVRTIRADAEDLDKLAERIEELGG